MLMCRSTVLDRLLVEVGIESYRQCKFRSPLIDRSGPRNSRLYARLTLVRRVPFWAY